MSLWAATVSGSGLPNVFYGGTSMINPDNLEIVMLIALIVILGCLVAFILNLSRRLDRQFAHIELSEAQFVIVNKQINSEAVKRYEVILEKLENLQVDIGAVNSQAVKRYEVIWDKIENLQAAMLEKKDQLIDLSGRA